MKTVHVLHKDDGGLVERLSSKKKKSKQATKLKQNELEDYKQRKPRQVLLV